MYCSHLFIFVLITYRIGIMQKLLFCILFYFLNSILPHLPPYGQDIIVKAILLLLDFGLYPPFIYLAIFILINICFSKSLLYTILPSPQNICLDGERLPENNMAIIMTLAVSSDGLPERLYQFAIPQARIHCTFLRVAYYHFLFTHFAYLRDKNRYLAVGLICIFQLKELSNMISPLRSVICF